MCIRIAFFFIASWLLGATPACAQGNVNDFGRPAPSKEREMYYAQVRQQVNQMLMRWQNAWERDDAAELAALYADRASYLPSTSGPVATRVSIRDYFANFLRTVGNVHVQMTDFGTSGDLAYLTGRISYQIETDGTSRQLVCTDLLVLRRRSTDNWQIETHLSREEPAENAAP